MLAGDGRGAARRSRGLGQHAGQGGDRDGLVEAGLTSVLNFAPTVLSVPDGVDVRKVDLAVELQILAFHEQRKNNAPARPADPAAAAPGAVAR